MLFHLHAVFLVIKCGDVRNINKMPHALISHFFYDILIRDMPSRNILFVEFRISVAL